MMEKQRLDKLIASTGKYSRKQAKELIKSGRVCVNGMAAKSGEQKVTFEEPVTLDGALLRNQKFIYIMMNKPAGVLSATRDPKQPTVLDLLPSDLRRRGLFPAGRLDKDTEGLLIITDDGSFAHRILSPANKVPKTYVACLSGPLNFEEVIAGFAGGIVLDGGERCSPAQLKVVQNGEKPQVELVIYEGMYHQVKRMFMRFGREVVFLRRIKIGGLMLDHTLSLGGSKEILHKELERI